MNEATAYERKSDSIYALIRFRSSTALNRRPKKVLAHFAACFLGIFLLSPATSVYGAPYVTGKVLGTVRNNYSGYVGMEFTVGASPVTVTALGRICLSGNTGTHTVKLVNLAGGTDVAGGSVSISMSGGTAGSFKYAALSSAVILAANTSYYLVSLETSGGDTWCNNDTTVTTTAVATEVASVHASGGWGGAWIVSGTAGHTFVPVDFQYSPAGALGNWSLTGNAGTTAGPNFLGTTDNQPLELHVNNMRAARLEATLNDADHFGIVNVVNGSAVNSAGTGVIGATIGGGGAASYFGASRPNTVTADFGTVGGGFGNTCSRDATVGEGMAATVAGGAGNASGGRGTTVGGGLGNSATGYMATVGGGYGNTSSFFATTVGGGFGNTTSNWYATVGGGYFNTSSGGAATVGGGAFNTSSGGATVGGGVHNLAGDNATVPGGSYNCAAGRSSFAAGSQAKANSPGQFVWADYQFEADFDPNLYGFYDNSFCVRATGGSVWITSTNGTTGPYFMPDDLGWRSSCDKNLKENFTPIDEDALLEQLSRMPITKWNAKAQSAEIKHIGPTAQDFHAAFGLGGKDDKSISSIDEGGVALAAIQGLQQKVESETGSLRAELKVRDAEIADLRQQLAELKKLVVGD